MADGEQIKDDIKAKIDAKKAKWESEWAAQIKADVKAKTEARKAKWESKWAALDFSWAGLADAAWDVEAPNEAQKLKRWRAPVSVPVDAHVIGDGENAFKPANLQDYWRWVAAGCGDSLASDSDLRAAGLLIEVDGTDWFALHRPEVQLGDAEAQTSEIWATAGAALAPLLMRALDAGGDTLGEVKYGKEDLKGPDRRAQLVGVRAQGLDAMWRDFAGEGEEKRPIHIKAARAGFGPLNASGLSFGPLANFTKAQFSGTAHFSEAQFSGNARFSQAQFSGTAYFREAQFSGTAYFSQAQFSGTAGFNQAQFSGDAGFYQAQFSGLADFREAQFVGPVSFAGKRDDGAPRFLDDLQFTNAVFADTADFSDTQLPHGPHAHQAFEGARFKEPVRFKNFDLTAFAAFDGAIIEKTIILDDPGEKRAGQHFRTALRAAKAAGKNEPDREAYLAALEGGLRTLKLAMSRVFDRQREQVFYRFELRTRRARASTPWWERGMSHLFAWLSDYGGSMFRPFAALALSVPLVAALVLGWGVAAQTGAQACPAQPCPAMVLDWRAPLNGPIHPDVWAALEFSARNITNPGSVWATDYASDLLQQHATLSPRQGGNAPTPWAVRLAQNIGPAGWLAVRILSTLQTFFALVMLFLFGLAVRRRFQIN